MGTKEDLKYVNLRTCCTPQERQDFIHIFKQYRDVFTWTYDDLKTYDTWIIWHVIAIKRRGKLFSAEIKKSSSILEPLIQKELRKLLDAQIIFKVRHSTWVTDLVHVINKFEEIRLCVDFHNLNQALDKDNCLVPSMEQILQTVSRSNMFSLLDGFYGYNKVLVAKTDWHKTTFKEKWGTFAFKHMPFGLINVDATYLWAMDIVFCVLIGQSVVVYLDDVMVFSKKIFDHFRHLRSIFKWYWK